MSTSAPKIALVIGINGGPETGMAPLLYAEQSAQQVAAVLTAPASGFMLHGGEPLLGAAATTDVVRRAIFDARRAAGAEGLLLIYYIGHGRYVTNINGTSDVYLVTHNFRPDDASEDDAAHLSMYWFREKVLRFEDPGHLLLVLDCCFAGAVAEDESDIRLRELLSAMERYIKIESVSGQANRKMLRKTLAAAGAREHAFEDQGITRYTRELLRGLSGGAKLWDGRVTWQSLHNYLQNTLTGSQQGEYGFDSSFGHNIAEYPRKPWVMPESPEPNFVGRVDELAQLEKWLINDESKHTNSPVAIIGMGGIGKTELAIVFAYRYREHFPGGVFWLNMSHPDGIEKQVVDCGGPQGLGIFANKPEGDISVPVKQVLAQWQASEKRLLIFDNLENFRDLETWGPNIGGSRILMTTRNENWLKTGFVKTILLKGLEKQDSYQLLLQVRARELSCSIDDIMAESQDAEAVNAIIDELEGNPFVLRQIARNIAPDRRSLKNYLNRLKSEKIDIISQILDPSYQRLGEDKTDEIARCMWLVAAQLSSDPIEAEILIQAVDLNLNDFEQDEQAEQALARLLSLGLIEQSNGLYRMHKLIADYAQNKSKDTLADRKRAKRALAMVIVHRAEEGKLWSKRGRYREHIRQLVSNLENHRDEAGGEFLYAAGLLIYEDGDYLSAQKYYQKALEVQQAILGYESRSIAETMHALGNVALMQGDCIQAKYYYNEALTIKRLVLEYHHYSIADTLHGLGKVAFMEGDYNTAEILYNDAILIVNLVIERNYFKFSVLLDGLGDIARLKKDYNKASQIYKESILIKKRILGSMDIEVASTIYKLGLTAELQDERQIAKEYYLESLMIIEKVAFSKSFYKLDILQHLGDIAEYEQEFDKAINFHKSVLGIKNMVPEGNEMSILLTLRSLIRLSDKVGDKEGFRKYYNEAIAIESKMGVKYDGFNVLNNPKGFAGGL